MKRVQDLPDWPPSNFAAFGAARGHRNPTHAGQVTIKDILRVTNDHVNFSCAFEGGEWTCDFYVPDRKTADQVAAILKKHIGENLLSIREEILPGD
jgi:hypothetical protein